MNKLRVKNTTPGVPNRPVGTYFYLDFPATKEVNGQTMDTDCDDGRAALQADASRESHLSPAAPSTDDYTLVLCGGTTPTPTSRPQLVDSTLRYFVVGGALKHGYAFFDAVDGTAAPAVTASNVYFVEQSGGESAADALTRRRTTSPTTYPQSAVSGVRGSAISSLTPSTTRPPELTGIDFRGDGFDNRFWFSHTAGAGNLQWVVSTRNGDVIANSGPAQTADYQLGLTDYLPVAGQVSSARLVGNTSLPVPIKTGDEVLVGLRLTVGGVAKDYVHSYTIPASPNAQIYSLPLPPATGGSGETTADGFVSYDTRVRRMGLFPYNNNRDATTGGLAAHDVAAVRWSATTGRFNMFYMRLKWPQCENADGTFDYRMLDEVLALANELQFPTIPYFDLVIGMGENPAAYLAEIDRMADQAGQPITTGGDTCASYNSSTARARHERLLRAMLDRIKSSPNRKWVLGIGVCNGTQTEHEYPRFNNTNTFATFDHGPAATAAFRAKTGQNPPVPPTDGQGNWFYGGGGVGTQWQDFRERAIVEYANWWHDLVKSYSTRLKTYIKFGNMWDGLSTQRGTSSIAGLLKHDIISQDNGSDYNFGMANAIALGDRSKGRASGDELFYVEDSFYPQAVQINWLKATFRAGATCCDWGAFYKVGGGEFDATKTAAARQWMMTVMDAVHAEYPIGATVPVPPITSSIRASRQQVLNLTWRNGSNSYEAQFNAAANNGANAVEIILNDDVPVSQ